MPADKPKRAATRKAPVMVAPELAPCVTASIGDLDPAALARYRAELAERRPTSSLLGLADQELLQKIGAIVPAEGDLYPSLAGILFFAREPQEFYPSLTITLLHFSGTSVAPAGEDQPLFLDNREFRGRLPEMLEATRAGLIAMLGRKAVMQGFRRADVLEYPEIALREALVNTLAHRDYSRTGSYVQVRLFADRLEFQSPGGLPEGLTVENLPYEQYTRNPHIMRLLEDYGYVERRGVGIDAIIRAMQSAGLPPPTFEDRQTSFWVTLRSSAARRAPEFTRLGLNDRQVEALNTLQQQGRITNREYQDMFAVSERTALYDLAELVEKGLILPVSSGRGRHYILRD
ncbi:MAG: winged helix-turn-helix transcriptional regulator [Chloroflexi bacterium]|nr:winged helix-turn-helix transcriptional regulator [Chloroflexota bacterium]